MFGAFHFEAAYLVCVLPQYLSAYGPFLICSNGGQQFGYVDSVPFGEFEEAGWSIYLYPKIVILAGNLVDESQLLNRIKQVLPVPRDFKTQLGAVEKKRLR
jgi:hypothetical protein